MDLDQRNKVLELRHRFLDDQGRPAMPIRLCVVALERHGWDVDQAWDWLMARGLKWLMDYGYHDHTATMIAPC